MNEMEKRKPPEVNLAGEFSETEEAMLAYLYAHPDSDIGTPGLMTILKLGQDNDEQRQQAYKVTQYAIETLVASGLVKGKRYPGFGDVYHAELRLTPKGEMEAIKQKRRVKKIIVDIPRPNRDT